MATAAENQAPEQQLVHVNIVPAEIDMDYAEAKVRLETILDKYGKVVVNADNVAACKRMATEVNQMAEQLNRYRIDKIKEARAPLDEADGKMKELVAMAKDVREKIKVQTDRYDELRLELARDLLDEARGQLWTKHKVDDEYKSAEYDDLVKLGALTGRQLTGDTFGKLEARVLRDKAQQQMVELRLSQLENRCHKAGLSTPLSREHVEAFLMAEDDVYEERLEKLFGRELSREADLKRRQEAEQQAAQERAEAEKAKAVEEAEARGRREAAQEAREAALSEPEEQDKAPAMTPSAPAEVVSQQFGEVAFWVVATYQVRVDETVSREELIEGEKKFLMDAGLTQLHNVTAHKA